MKETKRIESQLRRAHKGKAWHGPSLDELLANVTAEQAFAKPIRGAHTIWENVLHIAAWENAALQSLNGEKIQVPDEENFPAIKDASEEAWQQAQECVAKVNQSLCAAILNFPDERLYELIPEEKYSFYFLLHGVVQHTLYHAGQIALIKKAAGV
jgi:uncharacterized damage-inducible protein DinB